MSSGETNGSKFFWWAMGIVATVVSAVIVAALNLDGSSSSASGGPAKQGTAVAVADYSGTYTGEALNAGQVGSVQLLLNEADPASGSTTGQIDWSGRLVGSGPVRGTFTANNLTLGGEINSPEGPWDLAMNCTFSASGNVTCDYTLQPVAPNRLGPQQGSLSAAKL